jgi:hypothetical protein
VDELGASSRHLLDFLETEVLQAHDPPMQELMLRSSVLERLSGPLCDVVLDQQHSGPMLAALSARAQATVNRPVARHRQVRAPGFTVCQPRAGSARNARSLARRRWAILTPRR